MFDRIKQGLYWDKSLTLVSGCTPCSPGCDHCWALAMEKRFRPQEGIKIHPERLDIPLKRKKPTVWAIWNDIFHPDVSTRFIDHALEVMAACPQHIFLLLTKREYLINKKMYAVTEEHGTRELGGGDYIPNLWLGVTICNQKEANEKIPLLLQIPAAVRWVSIEPMLGPINITDQPWWDWRYTYDFYPRGFARKPIDWVVLGGETGPAARPMHPEWVRSVRDQCQAAGVPFFFKQWGKWIPEDHWHVSMGKSRYNYPWNYHRWDYLSDFKSIRAGKTGRLLDGREWNELPEVK